MTGELISTLKKVKTPCYVTGERELVHNLNILKSVETRTGCRILLAQKAFSQYKLYPLIGEYLSGTTASGLFEARLGHEEMGGENHVFSPAYLDEEFDELTNICDHIVFNSFAQWEKFGPRAVGKASCGLRINPEHSTQTHGIYDPCAPFSRMGVTRGAFRPECLAGIEGLHFHTLCEQDADALETTLGAVEAKFGEFLPGMKWLNFGGGHHITREGYDIERLVRCIDYTQNKYNVQVYLEPGEAVALNAGWLVASVLELTQNGMRIAILDASAACHMPDVLEMPYHPAVVGAGEAGEKPYTYRLAGNTCLAGDVIGDYSFDEPLCVGDKVIFCDMAIYSMVKNNTFNGMALPSIGRIRADGGLEVYREFGYADFKARLS